MPTVDELKAKGNAALQNGDADTAIAAYTEAIAMDPTNHVLYSNRSASFATKKEFPKALEDAEKCVSFKPDWVKGYTRKATALEFLDRYEEAAQTLEKAKSLEPDNKSLEDSLRNVQKYLVFEKTKKLISLNPKLAKYLDDPTYIENLKSFFVFQNFTASMSDPRIQETFTNLYTKDMDMDMDTSPAPATPPKKEAPKTEPTIPELSTEQQKAIEQKELGNSAYKNKDFETALKHYNAAIEIEPENATFYSNKTAVYFETKEYDKCIEECEKAIEIGRDNRADYKLIARLLARMGSCYEKKEDIANAHKFYEKSLSEFRSPDVIKKSQAVKKILDERSKQGYINPEIAEEEKNKGNKFFSNGKYPEALKHYSEAIKRDPTNAKLYSNRAACYSKLMEFPSALSDCDKCLELDPQFIKGYLRKGACLLAMKDTYNAKKAYSKALEIDPECSEAMDGLRQTYTGEQDPEKARQQALNDPEVAEILSDPAMRMILNQMEDPKAVREHLANPEIAKKFAKLVDAGLVSIR